MLKLNNGGRCLFNSTENEKPSKEKTAYNTLDNRTYVDVNLPHTDECSEDTGIYDNKE